MSNKTNAPILKSRNCNFLSAGPGGQRLRSGSGLVGFGCGDVRDDVRSTAVLQPGPRETVWTHPHGGHQVPTYAVHRRQVPAVRPAHQRPQQTVCVLRFSERDCVYVKMWSYEHIYYIQAIKVANCGRGKRFAGELILSLMFKIISWLLHFRHTKGFILFC